MSDLIEEAKELTDFNDETNSIILMAHTLMEEGQMDKALALMDNFTVSNTVSSAYDFIMCINKLIKHIEQEPKGVTVKDYQIINTESRLWIGNIDGEAGSFDIDKFHKCVDTFFKENF